MTSRRQFLKILPYSFLLTACKPLVFDTKKVVKYKLAANKTSFNFNEKFKANLLLYNNTNPGPLLKANVGDILKIDFKNNLDQPTSIHWHGIKNINKMDGVPYLTQDPVQPGETFSYEFPVNQSGTYWYHAHFESWKQVAKGLYGPLVVNDKTDDLIEDDIVILADDWRLNKKYQIDEKSFGSLMDWSHAGRVGNWLTINGKKSPEYSIKANSRARLRFINASNARILKFGSSLKNNNIIDIAEQEILKSNPEISDEELNMAINMTQKMLQPQWMATLSVLGGTFMGFFYSLIISFFLKKDDNNLMI